jgi:hypothetical protein
MFNQEPVRYPVGGRFYPAAFALENGLTGDLDLYYRLEPLGSRVNQVDTKRCVPSSAPMVLSAGGISAPRSSTAGHNRATTL